MTSREVLGLSFALSACSLIYELTIAGCYVSFTGDSPFWQSVTIGLYLAAMGAGAWACSRRLGDERLRFWRVELALCVAGAAVPLLLLLFESGFWLWQHFYALEEAGPRAALLALGTGQFTTLVIGWLSGFELPLLIRLGRDALARETGANARDLTREVLAANYLGALVGGLAFSFWLLPSFDLAGAAGAAAALNLAACFWLRRDAGAVPALALASAAWLALTAAGPLVGRFNAASFYAARLGVPASVHPYTCCSKPSASLPKVLAAVGEAMDWIERFPSRIQRVEVIRRGFLPTPLAAYFNERPRREPELNYRMMLHLDRRFQLWGATEAIYHEYLAHVPVQLFRRFPEEALILGGGDGLLAKELLKYHDRVKRIVNVELDPAMVRLAREEPWLRELNASAYHDPKVEVVVADAFAFVRGHAGRYDAVYIDFPFPYSYDTAKLYSAEFFKNVANLLKPGGFAVMDYPLATEDTAADLGPEGLRRNSIAVNTLKAGGFRTIVPYTAGPPELVPVSQAVLLGLDVDSSEDDWELGKLERRLKARRFMLRHPHLTAGDGDDLQVIRNQASGETMLAFTVDRTDPVFVWDALGLPLYALSAERLRMLEGGRYPYVDDKRLVNRLVRPTLFRSLNFAPAASRRTAGRR